MKKFPVLFLVLALAAGFAAAQEDAQKGIGLTAGVEFGVVDVNKPNGAEGVSPYLDIFVEYEKSFLDEALDISASLLYDIDLTKDAAPDGVPQLLTFDLKIGFNLGLGDSSTLSFILESQNDSKLFPKVDDAVLGIFRPGVKFNQSMGIGDLYAQLDFPVRYVNFVADFDEEGTYSGIDITLGWASAFGLGLKAGGHILVSPSAAETLTGFTGLSFTASYKNGPVYADVAAAITLKNKEFAPYSYFDTLAGSGVSITPSFTYSFDFGLSAYMYCVFDRIGLDGDVSITPAIGITYSF